MLDNLYSLTPSKGDFRSPEHTVPLDETALLGLAFCIKLEEDPSMEKPELPFLSQIVDRRINSMQLPIIFTYPALLAVNMFTINPGEAVVLLCDALTYFERKTVGVKELCAIYPNGFYKRDILRRIVEGEIRTNKHKWANVYNIY